jgi:hypothetical protein
VFQSAVLFTWIFFSYATLSYDSEEPHGEAHGRASTNSTYALTIPLPNQQYSIAANKSAWIPVANTYQGTATATTARAVAHQIAGLRSRSPLRFGDL